MLAHLAAYRLYHYICSISQSKNANYMVSHKFYSNQVFKDQDFAHTQHPTNDMRIGVSVQRYLAENHPIMNSAPAQTCKTLLRMVSVSALTC